MKKEKGQALIILLLIMLVALTVGLAITQRSLTDVASSNKVDQSSRAFSAAEAGLEKALQLGGPTTVTSGELQSQASASVRSSGLLPKPGQALEYPPIGKQTVAQFWLADPKSIPPNPPTTSYPANTPLTIYFGRGNLGANAYSDPQDPDLPALEVNLITLNGSTYKSYKTFYDPVNNRTGSTGNNFVPVGSNGTCQYFIGPFNTSNSRSADPNDKDRYFRCAVTITTPPGEEPIMIRARVLYTNTDQPIALSPTNAQNIYTGFPLPQQAEIYTSIGLYGNTQQKIQVFKMQYVVPAYFDYAIFSAGDISKVGS